MKIEVYMIYRLKINKLRRPQLIANVEGGAGHPELFGKVRFYAVRSGVIVEADIQGLPDSGGSQFFGFHIHEGRDCGGEGFSDSLGHYDTHGAPHPDHQGDLPPLLSCGGRAYMRVYTCRFTLSEVVGHTVIIHDMPDDFRTQPSGDSGSKIACGVIRA